MFLDGNEVTDPTMKTVLEAVVAESLETAAAESLEEDDRKPPAKPDGWAATEEQAEQELLGEPTYSTSSVGSGGNVDSSVDPATASDTHAKSPTAASLQRPAAAHATRDDATRYLDEKRKELEEKRKAIGAKPPPPPRPTTRVVNPYLRLDSDASLNHPAEGTIVGGLTAPSTTTVVRKKSPPPAQQHGSTSATRTVSTPSTPDNRGRSTELAAMREAASSPSSSEAAQQHGSTSATRTVSAPSTPDTRGRSSDAGKIALYIRSILSDINVPQDQATPMYEDNNGALMMANAGQPTKRTRHIDIRHFALLDWVERDLVILEP